MQVEITYDEVCTLCEVLYWKNNEVGADTIEARKLYIKFLELKNKNKRRRRNHGRKSSK